MSDTAGKPITCKAMVARAAKEPLVEETIVVAPPKAGEVRVKVICNALCHTGESVCLSGCSTITLWNTFYIYSGRGFWKSTRPRFFFL